MLYIKPQGLQPLLRQCRKGWYWFVLSFLGCFTLAALFLFVKNKKYEVYTSLQMAETGSGMNMVAAMAKNMGFADVLGLGSSEVQNEMQILQSHHVVYQAVKAADMNVFYSSRPFIKRKIYWRDAPVELIPDSPIFNDTLSEYLKWKISVNAAGTEARIKCRTSHFKEVCNIKKVSLPAHFDTPWGAFSLSTTPYFKADEDITVNISWYGYSATAQALIENDLYVDLKDKKADVIELHIADARPDRSKAFLNAIVEAYERYSIEAKDHNTQIADRLLALRIDSVAHELSVLEHTIEHYKSSHQLAMPEVEAELAVKTAAELKEQQLELAVRQHTVDDLLAYVRDPAHQYEALPLTASETSGKSGSGSSMMQYNEAVIAYQELSRHAIGDNPALLSARESIATLRKAVILTLETMQSSLDKAMRDLQREESKLTTLKAQTPLMTREYVELVRQQELKQRVLLMLQAQQEQNALTLNQDTPHSTRIDEAYTSALPKGPKPVVILVAALFFALLLPMLWLQVLDKAKPTVSSASELTALHGFTPDVYTVEEGHTEDLRALSFALHGRVCALSMQGVPEVKDFLTQLTPVLAADATLTEAPPFLEKADALAMLSESERSLVVVREGVTRRNHLVYLETLAHRGLLNKAVVAYLSASSHS